MVASFAQRTTYLTAMITLALGLAAADAQAARTFCCKNDRNQQQCGDVLPPMCRNREYVEYNEAGVQVKRTAAPLTEAQLAAKEAEDKKKRDQAAADEAQRRADTALLSTYADEKDLDNARTRALGEMERSAKSAEENLIELNKTKAALDAEAAKANGKPSPQLKRKIEKNQNRLNEQQAALDIKKKEIDETKAKFEGFRKRLQELKQPKAAKTEAP